ncbi:arylsulfatase, partial [Salmonella enterica]|nr:arylsulfatase [Salmonella enterica]
MKFKYALTSLALSVAILSSVPSTAFAIGGAIGGASGAKVDYQVQGKIGEVVMNPYDIAPLTAVI